MPLCLTRQSGQEILIGDNIRIRVLDIRGNLVRLSFDAPREIEIHRAERAPKPPAPAPQANLPSGVAGGSGN